MKHAVLFLCALLPAATTACSPGHDTIGDRTAAATLSPEEIAVILRVANDPAISADLLDEEADLDRRAAEGIAAGRPFATLDELDAVPFVGDAALAALLDFGLRRVPVEEEGSDAEVIFSPAPLDQSHNARIAELIDQAEQSVDIAIYSFSSSHIAAAIERAVARGLPVRVIYAGGSGDAALEGDELERSTSGDLELRGADVRFVNKIMHHKFVILDGPRDDAERAATAIVVSGSGNMSTGAATRYDENTVFLRGSAEAALAFQREFNLLWDHSRDVVVAPFAFDASALDLTEHKLPDDPGFALHVTSDNFEVAPGSTTFRTDRSSLVAADAWVAAIEAAQHQILIASGHLRLRPVAEALIAKRAANPEMDIRVYLDQQEFISFSGNQAQLERLEECLAGAGNEKSEFNCLHKNFLWGREVGDAGVDVRYKTYALRWHFSYAEQMHHKFMVIDGERLFTGSYNLSINAEHGTFENVMELSGPGYAELVRAYVEHFESIWRTGEDLLPQLEDSIRNDPQVPLVFASMALTEGQVTALRRLIRDNCAEADSREFRQFPDRHQVCDRTP